VAETIPRFIDQQNILTPNPDEPEPTRIFCPTGADGKNTDIFLFLAVFIPIRVYNLNFLARRSQARILLQRAYYHLKLKRDKQIR
jgi:hypothetical protein